ncbi:MAG: right-handed parallel beta-helix repeat-containing protein [Thermoplasmatales archaeon]|nr:MAG: right-handed parallel beta-helix repeat-containing protein [Thermoplasmatales archaeon]
MKRRIPVFGILIILIGISFTPLNQGMNIGEAYHPISTSNTLYVGGSGEGNYTKIQDAIDNASDGDTVYVYKGTYYENVLIDKSINLIGEASDTTVIDGNGVGDVVTILVNWVNLSGFTINHSGVKYNAGIKVKSSNNTICDNIISNNDDAIDIWSCSGFNLIINNAIISNNYGISSYSDIGNDTIIGNNISLNNIGIDIHGGADVNIIDNIVNSNQWGIGLSACHNSTIKNNTILSNNGGGIGIDSIWKKEIDIIGNNIQYNKGGIWLYLVKYINIKYNNIKNNIIHGIEILSGSLISVEINNITNNEVGCKLDYCGSMLIRKNNFIKNNNHTVFFWLVNITYYANYWDDWIGVKIKFPFFQRFPKMIRNGITPRIKFDWHPAKEPYDI